MKETHHLKSMTSPADKSLVRLNKFLSVAGVCSRRKADDMIQKGVVRVNGKIILSLGSKIDPVNDKVTVNDRQVVQLDQPVYVLFNKPKDCITTASDERGRATVMDYVQLKNRVFPIGRLDRNTTGVLLLTNDGELTNRLMHPKFEIQKSYTVTLDRPLRPEHANQLVKGIRLSEGKTKPAEVYYPPGNKKKFVGIVIHEGRNRQVHRMFEALGYEVAKLDRGAYAGITYEGVPRGRWRYLTRGEVRRLKEAAGVRSHEQT